MTEISFSNVVIVAAVAFAAPLVLGLIPKLRLSAIVLEIVLGIAVGPSGLGWVISDLPVQVLALVGLAFLLLLAGLGFVLSLGLALSVGYALDAVGQVRSPLFVGIVLAALEDIGIHYDQVTQQLQGEGVQKFIDSFCKLFQCIDNKRKVLQ